MNSSSGFSLKCPFHTFLVGALTAGALFAFGSLFLRKSGKLNRYDVESRFTDSIEYNGMVFISGQIGEGDTIEEQTRSGSFFVTLWLYHNFFVICFLLF